MARRVLALLLLAAVDLAAAAADEAKGGRKKPMTPGEKEKEEITLALESPGAAEPVNCEPTELEGEWLEMTSLGNYSQYKSVGETIGTVVGPPFMLTASDASAPGFGSSCISRSPSAPADCQGDDCFIYIDDFNATWLEFARLICYQTYPTPGGSNFFTSPAAPPGNVNFILTTQPKNYYYSDWFYSITDEWGNKWALQTYQQDDSQSLAANLAGVTLPPGWGPIENVTVEAGTFDVQPPWQSGGQAFWFIAKDDADNTWHQYTYPNTTAILEQSLAGAVLPDCIWLNAEYTVSAGGAAAAPAPAPVEAPAASGAGARAAGVAAALVAAVAALLA